MFYFGTGPRPFLFTADERKRKFVFKWPELFRCNLIMVLLGGSRVLGHLSDVFEFSPRGTEYE